jgi:hypothetical protein
MRFLFADYMLDTKRRELRRGSEPIEAELQGFNLLLRFVQHLSEPGASSRMSNLSEVFSLRPPDDLANFAESLRKSGLPDSPSGKIAM